jgi:hypothetical protein
MVPEAVTELLLVTLALRMVKRMIEYKTVSLERIHNVVKALATRIYLTSGKSLSGLRTYAYTVQHACDSAEVTPDSTAVSRARLFDT